MTPHVSDQRDVRQLYQRVQTLHCCAAGVHELLGACVEVMRRIRGLATRTVSPRVAHLARMIADDTLLGPLLANHDDALGSIYQAINAPKLESAYRATAHSGRKFTDDEIPAVTQLFTPRWVVEFLLHNTLGRLWRRWHPDSRVTMKWLVPLDGDEEPCRSSRLARTIRVLDPACGTMNFGLVAIELLEAMYREEIDHCGRAGWSAEPSVAREEEIAESIVENNVFGIDIDEVVLQFGAGDDRCDAQ
jgi:hypothetical protein